MKMKYYMRGMGVGIFVTSLIFLIAIAFLKPFDAKNTGSSTILEEQQSQTLDEAKEEETSEETKTESNKETTVSEDGSVTTVETIPGAVEDEADAAAEADATAETAAAEEEKDTTETISITINGGEGSNSVGNKLQQAGAVDSGSRFNRYLEDNNYDNVIQPGTYTVPKGSTYEEIANIITGR